MRRLVDITNGFVRAGIEGRQRKRLFSKLEIYFWIIKLLVRNSEDK